MPWAAETVDTIRRLMPEIVIRPPSSREELVAELVRVGAETVQFWKRFEPDEFFRPIGEAWSPCDNVRHLTRSVTPVAQALRVPRVVLALLFGRAAGPSRSYEAIETTYRQALAGGGRASGRFVPQPLVVPSDPVAVQRKIVAHLEAANAALVSRIPSWSETALDRYRLPHPLLGRLTVREMLFFTLFHGLHHTRNVARRKGLWPAA